MKEEKGKKKTGMPISLVPERNKLTIKKSSWNFPDSIAGNLLRRLDTCLNRELSQGTSPVFKQHNVKIIIVSGCFNPHRP